MVTAIPSAQDVSSLFRMLFGSETICRSTGPALSRMTSAVVATYRDNPGEIKRLLICDLAFANSAGAALSVISPAIASRATERGYIPENILANLSEVMNISVNLFSHHFDGRLVLATMTSVNDIPPEIECAWNSNRRAMFELSIPHYQTGRVDLVIA